VQSINEVNSLELRNILVYLGAEHVSDKDIPHADRAKVIIDDLFKARYSELTIHIRVRTTHLACRVHHSRFT
jgi:hypothetical protein